MILPIFFLLGLVILALLIFAEAGKMPLLGMTAAVVLLILGFWIFSDGLQYQSATGTTMSENQTVSGNNTQTSTTKLETPVYSDLPTTPVTPIPQLLAIIFIILSIYGLYHYISIMVTEG